MTGKARKIERTLRHEIFTNSIRRAPTPAQVFSFVVSSSESAAVDNRNLSPLSVPGVWQAIRDQLGVEGSEKFISRLNGLDATNGWLDRDDVERAFGTLRLDVPAAFMDVLFDEVASDGMELGVLTALLRGD